jgi:hypothetical protein
MKRDQNSKIDFIGIGVQKSGTTWLYQQLIQLKHFNLPPVKECHYFDRSKSYPSPSDLSNPFFWSRIRRPKYIAKAFKKISAQKDWYTFRFYLKWYFSNYNDDWYLSLFNDLDGFTGEITPSYSVLNLEDIQKMYRLAPKAKIILLLRNPVDRAWSQFRHHVKKSAIDRTSSIEEIKAFINSDVQSLRSDYLRAIKNYSKVYPKEQILIGFFDAIVEEPADLLNSIVRFITGQDVSEIEGSLNFNSPVNKSPLIDCPSEVRDYLASKYYEQILSLKNKYGGYFNKWYADLYLNEELEKTVRYKSSFVLT